MSKRQNQKRDDDETTGSASKRARITPGNASTTKNPPASCGLKNSLHGNVFQLKLLMLFLLRGIGAGFQFHLGTEIPGMGGKFDDLIFKFNRAKNNNEATSPGEQTESYRFLQAKHKQNEQEKITADDLLKDNDGEFSLPKYFRSYYRDVIQRTEGILPENVQDCIICTNIGFDSDAELRKKGIELIPLLDDRDPILTFKKVSGSKKSPTCYKLRKTEELRRTMTEWSDIHLLAKTLLDNVTENKKLTISSSIFKQYHIALVDEKVIDKKEAKLCTAFLEGDNSRFREILSEITFVHYWAKLSFKSENKKTIRADGTKKITQFEGTSIEKQLPKYSTKMEFDFRVFEDYYKDLVSQKVIVPEQQIKKPFTKEFIKGINSTQEGLQFRGKLRNAVFIHYWKDLTIQLSGTFGIKPSDYSDTISLKNFAGDEEIGDFLDKLVFAVHTPNEVELDGILKNEVSDRYSLNESDIQSDFILRNMLDWFKEKESKFMTSEEGKNIFKEGKMKLKSLRVTAISIDYQKQLKELLEFNEKAIDEMKEKLTQLLTAENRIGRIATPLPKRTAVKVIAALEMLREQKTITHNTSTLQEYFHYEDSYLVTPSSRLQKDCSKFKKTLKSENSHHLLVVISEDGIWTENEDEFYQKLVKKMRNKRIVFISQGGAEVEDELNFGDLSEKSKRALLEKQIEFQGTLKSVGELIKRGDTTLDDLIENGDLGKVMDCNAIEELLMEKGKIIIPACSSARFEPELYVERRMEHPWENHFYDELAASMKCTTDELQKECTVDSQGYIQWMSAEDSRKKEIWKQMKIIVEKKERQKSRDSQLSHDVVIAKKNPLLNRENRKGQVFIISGIAGTGKSTIFSNYYEIIKRDNPDIWAIRIDLVDYSKELAEFNFSPGNQSSSAILFFADIFAKNSPLARSLLTHRFRTDSRIVVMLDGFDEIDGKLHEKVFQLIKAISLTKMDALYITTRPHLMEKLQDEFFQFSFTFKNFSQDDQVDCLSKYWGSKLKMSQTTDGPIQLFAESLVERLTTTLSDRESGFIGIPLQCRVLAECFETQLQDAIQQGLPIATLIENISESDLDLTSLFSLLMKTKLEIYRAEKFKADPHNHQANWVIENTMKNLENYLRKLAIRTIVFYPKYVNVFLGHSNSFSSNQEISQEEKQFTFGGVCFGFLDKNGKGEVKFLHRTYAEFLFAKYLYRGFLPENNENYNKLLEWKPVRKMIFKKILVKEPYNGVRVFFNAMLNEWEPMAHLSREIKQSENILGVAISDRNANIFMFMCDCLDLSLDKVKIRRILSSNVFHPICDDPFFYDELSSSMYEQNSKVFERFISYYDEDADQLEVQRILNEMLYQPLYWMKDSELNQEEIKKIVKLALGFLGRSQEALRQISGPNFKDKMQHIFKVFICNEYYDNLLENLLVLLSSAYSNDELFEDFFADTVKVYHRNISHGKLEKTLRILRGLGRDEVLKGISHQILKMDIQLFKRFYSLREEGESRENIPFPADIQSLLVRDSHRMTRLHRAALYDDEETVDQILETIRISYSSNETECKNLGKEVLYNVIASDEKGITPLYVAAASERENLCQKMLIFLKEMLSEDELRKYLTDTNGFLGDALWDAMKWKKIQMFRIILKSTKTILGQDYLIDLLKAQTPEENHSRSMFSACDDKILFDIVVDVIIDDENDYNRLNDLLLQNRVISVYNQLQHMDEEIFQKMSSMNRLDDWIKRLLDSALQQGKKLVFCNLLEKIAAHPQLLGMVILVESGTKSYLDMWFDFIINPNNQNIWDEDYVCLKRILKCLSEKLGQSAIKELLVRNDYKIINSALLFGGRHLVDVMLTFLPNQKDEITKHLVNDIPHLIREKKCGCNQPDNRCCFPNILNFAFDFAEDCDLSKLIDLIFDKCLIDDSPRKKRSIWSDYLDINRNHNCAKNVPEKVDKFLKCVSEKLGQSAVEKLVVEHEDGQVITQVLTRNGDEKLVNALLRHLSEERREEMERKLVLDAPTTITNLMDTNEDDCPFYWMNILHLEYVTKYADSGVLLELIEIITESNKPYPDSDRTTSVWSSYLFNSDYSLERTENVDKFLLDVSNKLGKNKVKELVLHSSHSDGARQSVISSAASYGENDLVEAMLAHLTDEDRQEIQREHVDTAVEPDAESLTSNYSTDEDIAS